MNSTTKRILTLAIDIVFVVGIFIVCNNLEISLLRCCSSVSCYGIIRLVGGTGLFRKNMESVPKKVLVAVSMVIFLGVIAFAEVRNLVEATDPDAAHVSVNPIIYVLIAIWCVAISQIIGFHGNPKYYIKDEPEDWTKWNKE